MKQCFANAEKVLQRKLTEDEKTRIKGVVQRVISSGKGQEALERTLQQAIDDNIDKAMSDLLALKRNEYLNRKARDQLSQYIDDNWSHRMGEGIEAFLVGVYSRQTGTRNNVAAAMTAQYGEWGETLLADLDRMDPKMHVKMAKGEYDKDIYDAIYRIDRGQALDNLDPAAVTIARKIQALNEEIRLTLNRDGANIHKREGFTTTQNHDMWRIRGKRAEWTAFMRTNLDLDKTFENMSNAEIDEALNSLFTRFSEGSHVKATPEASRGLKGPSNIGKLVSHQRKLIFKTAQGEYEYNRDYGAGTVIDSIMRRVMLSGQNGVLMRKLGPNAEANLKSVLDQKQEFLQNSGDEKALRKFNTDRRRIEKSIWPTLTGESQIPANAMLAQGWSAARTIKSMASLGSSVLSGLGDIFIAASESRFQGRSMLAGIGRQIGAVFQSVADPDKREVLASMGIAMDGFSTLYAGRFTPEDTLHGHMSKWANRYYKWNLLTPWTDRQRAVMALSTSGGLTTHIHKSLDDLPAAWQRILGMYDIDDAKWDAMRVSQTADLNGNMYLTGEAMEELDDTVIDQLLTRQGKALTDRNRWDARKDLGDSFRTMLQDRVASGVVTPGTKARATLLGGSVAGTHWGEIIRSIAQFKMFPIGILQNVVAREAYAYGAGETGHKVMGFANLAIWSMAFGYASMALKDLSKGREPRVPDEPAEFAKIMAAAMTQGGAFGIYGDFLFGEYKNRFGGSAISTALGPLAGTISDAGDLFYRMTRGEDFAGQSLRFVVNNTPFMNLFYTKWLLDYAFLYGLQEAANPGYLRRMEQRILRENDQVYMLPPSTHANRF